jgi:hypothetical protein
MPRRYGWLLLILLAAAFLRLANLSEAPPGLTHDEADHGLDAWGVVNGVRPIYFSVGYGREPLFDYATAGLMTILGPTYLAGRLTAVYFGLVLVAGTYAWTRRAFDNRTALLSAAGLAVSFWPVMTARQALRSVTLPALFVLAATLFWYGLKLVAKDGPAPRSWSRFRLGRSGLGLVSFSLAGLLLGATIYTYFPARILWLAFPLLLAYLALANRRLLAKVWPGTLLMLVVGAVIAAPLVAFLVLNPGVEARIEQLSDPLAQLAEGNWRPLLSNAASSLLVLGIEGDHQWRYNIPGQPLLPPLLALLFLIGLALALWWVVSGLRKGKARGDPAGWSTVGPSRSEAATFAVIWLLLGLSPALITGPELSTTRIIGLQPVLTLFPALALAAGLGLRWPDRRVAYGLTGLLFAVLMAQTARNYFLRWAKAPEVRVQYESSLVSTIRYLNQHGAGPTAISTTTPGQFHSPAIAFLTADNPLVELRWFNGQHSLLAPQETTSTFIFTGFAPLDPDLQAYFQGALVDELPLRPDDEDRPVTIYVADGPALLAEWQRLFSSQIEEPSGLSTPVQFGDAIELLGYLLQTPAVGPGDEVRLATLWRVSRPLDEAVLFTQVVGRDGLPLAQSDRLDVPSHYWAPGDVFIQLHRFALPNEVSAGEYPILIGAYTRPDLERLPVMVNGTAQTDHLSLPALRVIP